MRNRERADPLDDIDDQLAGDEPEPPAEPEPEGSEIEPIDEPTEDGSWNAEDEDSGTSFEEDLWDELPEPPQDWAEERDGGDEVPQEVDRMLTDDEWANLEDEGRLLPSGAVLLGLREVVALPDHDNVELVAIMNTSLATSVLHARYELIDGLARLWIGDRGVALPVGPAGAILTVALCGRRLDLVVALSGHDAEEPLELGRDALEAGRFLVDVGRSFVHRVAGAVPWRM